MASFREPVSNSSIRLFSLLVYVASEFFTAINCFSPPLKQKLIGSLSRFYFNVWNICVESRGVISCY